MERSDISPLVLLLVDRLSKSLALRFEVAMLSVLVIFLTYMRATTIRGYYFSQKAILWGAVESSARKGKVRASKLGQYCHAKIEKPLVIHGIHLWPTA